MTRRRRRVPRGWLPGQHGAWAMLVAPVVVGAWPGSTWLTLLLLVSAVTGFCALNALGLWLKSGRRASYRAPALVYPLVTVALVAWLALLQPRVLSWSWVFAPLLAVSLWASARRSDRSWWNDAVLVLLGTCLTLVSAGLAGAAGLDGGSAVLAGPLSPPPLGLTTPGAMAKALVLLAYFAGTVIHVKALIRERRRPWVSRLDVGYHALLVPVALGWTVGSGALGWTVGSGAVGAGILLTAVAIVLAWRAWWIVTRRRDLPVKTIGMVEIAMTVLVAVAAIAVGGAVAGG